MHIDNFLIIVLLENVEGTISHIRDEPRLEKCNL